MTTLIPDAGQALHLGGQIRRRPRHLPGRDPDAGGRGRARRHAPAPTSRLFAGAKEWDTIRAYQNDGGVWRFIDSIDWGWFFFLTKPIFCLLHWLHGFIGNMGWSIIALTLVLKALVFPLAYKSYVSMAQDEGTSARDGEAEGARRRRPA